MRTAEEWAAEASRRLNEKMEKDHAAGQCGGDLADAERILADIVREAVAAERERCAKVAENGSFLHSESLEAQFGRAVAAAIRRQVDLPRGR